MRRNSTFSSVRAARERGGITILVALILLGMMTLGAFAMAKNSLREVAVTGNTWQAAKAAEAADAGLDWFVVWTHPANADAATTVQRKNLVAGLRAIGFVRFADAFVFLAFFGDELRFLGSRKQVRNHADAAGRVQYVDRRP